MFMAVVQVWVVHMPVPKRLVPVPVRMGLRQGLFVRMTMMLVVDMGMLVLDRFMRMVMAMPFGQMQP